MPTQVGFSRGGARQTMPLLGAPERSIANVGVTAPSARRQPPWRDSIAGCGPDEIFRSDIAIDTQVNPAKGIANAAALLSKTPAGPASILSARSVTASGTNREGKCLPLRSNDPKQAALIENRMQNTNLRPMLATLIDSPFDDKDWVFETKWDGFRLVAKIGDEGTSLYSRNGNNVTARYARVAEALGSIDHHAVIDGELVALDAGGRSRFQLLQNALRGKARLRYYVFDLMFLDGRDMRSKPLLERKQQLRSIISRHPLIRYSPHSREHGIAEFDKARRAGEEGIIAKRAAGLYYSGKRTREWLKIKAGHEQEAVIVGFTAPRGSREYFGSVALAVYDKGKLVYVGHSGGGFSRDMLRTLHARMMKLKTDNKPFTGIAHERQTTWIRPQLVCQVKFTEWTDNGEMRHPVFLGLRTDKPARQVRREQA